MTLATRTPQRPLAHVSRAGQRYLRSVLADVVTLYPMDERNGSALWRAWTNPGQSPLPDAFSSTGGTVTPGATTLVPGWLPFADFAGGYGEIADHDAFSPFGASGQMAVELICRPNAVNLAAQMLVTKHTEWQLRIESDGSLLWDLIDNVGGFLTAQSAASVMAAGVTHHIVATYDRSLPRAEIWLDGVSVASDTTLSGAGTRVVSGSSQPVQVGHRADAGGSTFAGALGWLAFYPTPPTGDRIKEHGHAFLEGAR